MKIRWSSQLPPKMFRDFPAVSWHRRENPFNNTLITFNNHHQLSLTIINHHQLSLTIMNHHELLLTFINHHFSPIGLQPPAVQESWPEGFHGHCGERCLGWRATGRPPLRDQHRLWGGLCPTFIECSWFTTMITMMMGIPRSNLWRYCTVFLAIFCGDIPLHRPYIW